MLRIFALPGRFVLPLLVAALASDATAQQAGGAQRGPTGGLTREQMWPAPTAEDWAKPCLITWQRTWEDAIAISQETGQAILVCVNMDGEIASEHYAGIRYRQPEIAALYQPYVTVLASVYRHTPRDYDEDGERILCPRFGSVTCGEHIAMEPFLFEKFMDGQRISPRHIAVELDQAEIYDVYYAWDTDSVFQAVREGVANRPEPNLSRGDRTLEERVASRDIQDRVIIEEAYRNGDLEVRRSLLRTAISHRDIPQGELFRLALFGDDLEMRRMAFLALTEATSPTLVPVIAEALRFDMDPEQRQALIAALVRMGETSPEARTLAAVYQGLATSSKTIDVESWARALEKTYVGATEERALETDLEAGAKAFEARPEDAEARLDFAEASLALAAQPGVDRRMVGVLTEDARLAVEEATVLGAEGWRPAAIRAVLARGEGRIQEARELAVTAAAGMPSDTDGWLAVPVLELFIEYRQRGIARAVREKTEWPKEWFTDVDAAYTVLATHPLGTDYRIADHFDLLAALKLPGRAAQALEDGLRRFPDSWILHDRLRRRLLTTARLEGLGGLESTYEAMLAEENAPPNLPWFAGYASLVTAEYYRRGGRNDEAVGAYGRAIQHYENSILANEYNRESADHYIAMAKAGRARLAVEAGDLELALTEIQGSFQRRPEAAGALDGLALSPLSTARMLLTKLNDANRSEEAEKLKAGIDALPTEAFLPPEFERNSRGRGPSPDARRFGGQRGGRRPQGQGGQPGGGGR